MELYPLQIDTNSRVFSSLSQIPVSESKRPQNLGSGCVSQPFEGINHPESDYGRLRQPNTGMSLQTLFYDFRENFCLIPQSIGKPVLEAVTGWILLIFGHRSENRITLALTFLF